jgi:hypothetical protein
MERIQWAARPVAFRYDQVCPYRTGKAKASLPLGSCRDLEDPGPKHAYLFVAYTHYQ